MIPFHLPAPGLTAATLVLALLSACGQSDDTEKESPQQTSAAPAERSPSLALTAEEVKAAGIEVETVQPQTVNETLALTGTITPNQDRIAKVTPRLTGRVASVAVAQGTRVKAGQVLAVLESIELGETQSAYLQARSEATVTEAALKRAEQLAAEDIVPQKDYLRAKADAERARAALRAAADKLQLLGVPPAETGKQSAQAAYPLQAPFAGTVIEKKAVPGELAPPDQSLFTVADLSTVWLEADVFEKDLDKLRLGASAEISVAAYPETVIQGRLTYLAETMDTATRTVKGRIEIPNTDGRLKPGMFATAHLRSTVSSPALVLPEPAVLLVQGQPTVFVATAKGFVPRPVETGSAVGGRIPIRMGLSAGERVVVAGGYELKARLLKSQIGTEE